MANESNPIPIVLHHHPLHGILEDLVGAPAPKPGQVFFPPFVIIVGAWTVPIGLVVLAISGAWAVRRAAWTVAVGAAAAWTAANIYSVILSAPLSIPDTTTVRVLSCQILWFYRNTAVTHRLGRSFADTDTHFSQPSNSKIMDTFTSWTFNFCIIKCHWFD